MARRRHLISIMAASMLLAAASAVTARAEDFTVAGYLSWWSAADRPELFDDLAADKLTHIIYAFGAIDEDGEAALANPCSEIDACDGEPQPIDASTIGIPVSGTFQRLHALKKAHPHLKILVAFGGWTGSAPFSSLASTADGRARFAQSILDVFFRPYPGLFDGVDIDWEYPVAGGLEEGTPADRENLSLLLASIREALDGFSDGTALELTVAVAASPGMIASTYPQDLADHVDRINVMTYDYHAGATVTNFNAPLAPISGDPNPDANIAASMAAWQAAGVAASKLAVGIPFYGRAFSQVSGLGDGLLRPGDPTGTDIWSGDGIAYRDLVAARPLQQGFQVFWNEQAEVPYLYNAAEGVWISYDNARSVAAKTEFARRQGQAGVILWELGSDDGTLLDAVGEALSKTQ
jgi:chitinase